MLKDGGGARRIQLAKFSQVRKALFSCTMEAHAHQIVVKEIVLQEKSVQLGFLTNANINFSEGWRSNFQKCFNVRSHALHGEAASVD